ncbi:hypothetical protein [Frigoriglobus tundricola]|uniref:hypothetical protein n=1 Tax=Frigoriglobus tundricola TaxID=2774151 RepID=UPI00148ED6CD|nr:hypothetical protein [Frigoriglobus tundricola]
MAENVDPDQAKRVLQTALDAWKGGLTSADLEAQQPSIIMNEADWTNGNRLLDYKMNDAGKLDGRQVRWVVQIKLQDKNGKVTDRKATYIIDTVPRVVIVRDSFAS